MKKILSIIFLVTAWQINASAGVQDGPNQALKLYVQVAPPAGSSFPPDNFTDGDYTSDPTWTVKGLTSASWSAATNKAIITGTAESWAGLLETPYSFTTKTVSVVLQSASDSTIYFVYLKSCNTTPTTIGPEAGCYTAEIFMGNDTVLPPPFPPFETTMLTLYAGESSIATDASAGWPGTTAHTLTLVASGGTVTASYDSGAVLATASDATYSSFTNVGFGAKDVMAAGANGVSFDDVDIQ